MKENRARDLHRPGRGAELTRTAGRSQPGSGVTHRSGVPTWDHEVGGRQGDLRDNYGRAGAFPRGSGHRARHRPDDPVVLDARGSARRRRHRGRARCAASGSAAASAGSIVGAIVAVVLVVGGIAIAVANRHHSDEHDASSVRSVAPVSPPAAHPKPAPRSDSRSAAFPPTARAARNRRRAGQPRRRRSRSRRPRRRRLPPPVDAARRRRPHPPPVTTPPVEPDVGAPVDGDARPRSRSWVARTRA